MKVVILYGLKGTTIRVSGGGIKISILTIDNTFTNLIIKVYVHKENQKRRK